MKITALTPTCDRPIAFALCERLMERQTLKPDQWVVADGGQTPVDCTMGQIHLHDPRPPGPLNFATNLLNGVAAATGELVVVFEDDDWYSPTHIERMAARAVDYRLIGSEDVQRYHNVAQRCFRRMDNVVGASLCQTAFRRELFPLFRRTVQECMGRNSFSIDANFWRAAGVNAWGFTRQMTVCGIKGLPGRIGLGVGHRPDARWTPDPNLAQLREWIGEDADLYAGFRFPKAA